MECNNCFAVSYFINRIAKSGRSVLLAIDDGYVNTSKIAIKIKMKPQAVSRTLTELRGLGLVDVTFLKTKSNVINLKRYDYHIVDDPLIKLIIEKMRSDE